MDVFLFSQSFFDYLYQNNLSIPGCTFDFQTNVANVGTLYSKIPLWTGSHLGIFRPKNIKKKTAPSSKTGWTKTGWWQLKDFLCSTVQPENWGNDPIWLIFFRWVGSTTKQKIIRQPASISTWPSWTLTMGIFQPRNYGSATWSLLPLGKALLVPFFNIAAYVYIIYIYMHLYMFIYCS